MTEIITHNGKPAVYLADHRGRKHLYLFRVEVDGVTTRYTFEKLGDLLDSVHTVTHRPGDWRCSCRAYLYSSAVFKSCKHEVCARDVASFITALTPTKETANV